MERSQNAFAMEQTDMHQPYQYSSREPGHEGFLPAAQAFMIDPASSRNANMRLPDLNVSEVKPVNYSIQTGEEFAFEFMRDRVIHKKPLVANTAGDPSYAPGYMEIKGLLGLSHTGSESGSDISMLTLVEKGPKEFERTNLSLHEERSNYRSVQSGPRSSSSYGSRGPVLGYTSSGTSGSLSPKIKVLCSFGGKILPRPSDGKLRYVGGETHIIRVSRDISWRELKQKILAIYDQTHVIKYQLPGEDLDALVSVSCDEDFLNMMEEWNEVVDREGSQKLRMFLFSMSDLDDANFSLGSLEGDSEIQYVVAVNGMDLGSRRNSIMHGLASSSGNNLDELDRLAIDKETSRIATVSVGVSTSVSAAQPFLQSSSNANETYPQVYHGQLIDHRESQQCHGQLMDHRESQQYNGQLMDHREPQQFLPHTLSSSSNYSPLEETAHSMPLQGIMNQQRGLIEGQPGTSFEVHNPQEKLKPELSFPQETDTEKSRSVEKSHPVPPVPFDEAPAAVPVRRDLHSLPSKKEGMHQEPEMVSSSVDAAGLPQVSISLQDDPCSTSYGAFAPSESDSVSNLIDLSYLEPSVPPQRVYCSERIPREQADLLSRLTKSDDSLGSQLLNSIAESVEKLHHSNLAPSAENSISSSRQPYTDDQTINNGLAQLQKYKEFADSVPQMNNQPSGIEHVLDDSVSRDSALKDDFLMEHSSNYEKLPAQEMRESGSGLPVVESKGVEITGNDFSHAVSGTEDLSKDVPQGEKVAGIPRTKQSDISIDINDRFPRDFLSEIFTKGISDDISAVPPIRNDGVGVSVNMENHERKHWSYFQKLVNEGYVQEDVSLTDQDNLSTPALTKIEEGDQKSYYYAGTDGISMNPEYPQIHFGEDNNKNPPGVVGAESTEISDFGPSQVKDSEMQFDENLKAPESGYKVVKSESRNAGLPPLDPSLVDIDINTLQVIRNGDLEELRELGSGTFGTVYHGKWRGSDVAIKRLKKICFTGRSSEEERLTLEFWREAEILSKLHHPNVVAFYGVVQDGPGGTLATVTEYMVDGSLRHVLLKKDRYLDRRKRLLIAMDAAFGMEYLHSKNIVHFDLKCDNLLVNLKDPQRPICKVGDFGLSKIKRNTLVSGGVRGTLPWMAPELLNGSSNKVSEKVDVFSFGIVLWEILTGDEPYANMHYGAIIGGIVNNTLRPTIPSYCDAEWKRLMEQCWAPNPAVRPSFTEIAGRLRVMSTAAGKGQNKTSKAEPAAGADDADDADDDADKEELILLI
ncbi:Protein kinase superfamily protein with octicosapeptide/Phox/Bem1p domain [Euphorbia peplus]|nr:Protein kinase superfamily protein with octicosapeptide/Phox/Bem1p domain [Euphorbia peplus]